MCDTLCALPARSKNGVALFAKNSDRSPNEPHLVVRESAKSYAAGNLAQLTYISLPQAPHTLETLLCKPSWTWGAEMGVNSASVAIGNEAVFTRTRRGPKALIGMDLVRLALERSVSAGQAVSCITELLETYGQGGNCGFDHPFYYDNSFLIADPAECYVLETAGKKWAAKKVSRHASISNRLGIHTDHTLRGGIKEGYDFAKKQTKPLYTFLSASGQRQQSSCNSLQQPADAAGMMAALRQHHPKDENIEFTRGSVRSVCMHAGGRVGDHTTGSVVIALRMGQPTTVWCTAASTPCIAAFKPVFFGIPSGAPVFEAQAEAESEAYWLQREAVHRGILSGQIDAAKLRAQRNLLEAAWLAEEEALFAASAPEPGSLSHFAQQAALQEQSLIDAFLPKTTVSMPSNSRFSRYWAEKNAALGEAPSR